MSRKKQLRPVECLETGVRYKSIDDALLDLPKGKKEASLIRVLDKMDKTFCNFHWVKQGSSITLGMVRRNEEVMNKAKIICEETGTEFLGMRNAAKGIGVKLDKLNKILQSHGDIDGYHWRVD